MRTIIVLFFVTLLGCQAEIDTTSHQSAIINGTVDTDASHDAVPFLYNSAGYGCGGTLITPTILMTAAHCVTMQDSSTPYPASNFSLYFCPDMENCDLNFRQRGVSEVYVHPWYNSSNTSYDFALLRLDSPAPGDVVTIPPLPSSLGLDSSDAGMSVTFIGYGLTDGYDDTSSSSVRMKFTGILQGVCHSGSSCSLGSGYYAAPMTLYTSQAAGGTCQGDSGGPALVNISGTVYVAGITSYGYNYCTGPGVYTEVSYYASEIQDFIAAAPAEVCTDGIDNNGNGMADCADPACASHASCPTDSCADAPLIYCNNTKTGNTDTGTAAFADYSCLSSGSEEGSELAFAIAMPEGTVATFSLTSYDQDLDLFVVEGDEASCDTQACVESSINVGLSDESISYTVTSQPAYIVIESYKYPGRYRLEVACDLPPENCNNHIDDDMNGYTDCQDPVCAQEAHCLSPETEISCVDGIDNDEDGFTDCDDDDCQGNIACATASEFLCDDGIDNDLDGAIDCDDADCNPAVVCQNSNTDDSGDGSLFGCTQSNRVPLSAPLPMLLLILLAVAARRRL